VIQDCSDGSRVGSGSDVPCQPIMADMEIQSRIMCLSSFICMRRFISCVVVVAAAASDMIMNSLIVAHVGCMLCKALCRDDLPSKAMWPDRVVVMAERLHEQHNGMDNARYPASSLHA